MNDAESETFLYCEFTEKKISIEEEKAVHNGRLGQLLGEGRMTHLSCVSIPQLIPLFMAGFSLLVWRFCAVCHLLWEQAVQKFG